MALSAPHRVVLVQHRIDAVCDLVRKVIIVLDVAAVDVNRQPAHVDGLGVANCTAASCSCLCQLTGVDFWNREPGKHTAHGVRQAPHRVHHNLAALLDALCHEFHEVGHILVSMRKRSFLRNGETEGAINRRGQIACSVLHAPGVVIDTGCQHFRDLFFISVSAVEMVVLMVVQLVVVLEMMAVCVLAMVFLITVMAVVTAVRIAVTLTF